MEYIKDETEFDKDDILIVNTSISNKKEDVFKALKNDQILIDSINEYKDKLIDENVEIFHEKNNILITENGYFLAVFVGDVFPMEEENE